MDIMEQKKNPVQTGEASYIVVYIYIYIYIVFLHSI